MQPIATERRDDIVYKQLLDNIKSGAWKSGDKLPTEAELCGIFNVSRSTIRAAIQRLRSIGLVETVHGKGTYICDNHELFDHSGFTDTMDISAKEYRDMIELRSAIENSAVRAIIDSGEEHDFSDVKAAFQGMEAAAAKLDYVELTKYDLMFHLSIIICSGNSIFIQIMRIFHDEYYKVLLETNKLMMRDHPDEEKMHAHFMDCIENHRHLLNGLLSNQSGEAIAEQDKFLQRNKERIDYFFQRQYMNDGN